MGFAYFRPYTYIFSFAWSDFLEVGVRFRTRVGLCGLGRTGVCAE